MLALNNIEVVYDGVILVLKGVSLNAEEGHITTLLGANGAGKTTTLKAISGLLHTERGEVTKGSVELDGKRLDRLLPFDVVKHGVVQVFEGRRVFENLTAEENLIAGAHSRKNYADVRASVERVYDSFPALKERRHQAAGYLSGGEQQMLVIGRALAAVQIAASAIAADDMTARRQSLEPYFRDYQPNSAGPFPAILLVSGCGGFAPRAAPQIYTDMAEGWRAKGYVVVFVDYL